MKNQKSKIKIQKVCGLWSVVCGLIILSFCNPAFGYAGNVYVDTSAILTGATNVYLFAGSSPNQDSTDADASALLEGTNYSISISGSDTLYAIYDSSSSPAYMLVLKSGTYAILGPISLGTTVPSTTNYSSATFYNTGNPDDPTSVSLEAGYETASATWSLNTTDYEISGVDLQVANDAGFLTLLQDEDGNTTTSLGNTTGYTIGALIDGRELSPDTTYYLRVKCSVDGGYESDWADTSFSTLAMNPELTFLLTLESQVPDGTGPGINFFSMPFASPWYAYATDGSLLGVIENAYNLIMAINAANIYDGGAGDIVSSFSYWDSNNQELGKVVIVEPNDFTDYETELEAIAIEQGRGYQVYVTDAVELVISNTEL